MLLFYYFCLSFRSEFINLWFDKQTNFGVKCLVVSLSDLRLLIISSFSCENICCKSTINISYMVGDVKWEVNLLCLLAHQAGPVGPDTSIEAQRHSIPYYTLHRGSLESMLQFQMLYWLSYQIYNLQTGYLAHLIFGPTNILLDIKKYIYIINIKLNTG